MTNITTNANGTTTIVADHIDIVPIVGVAVVVLVAISVAVIWWFVSRKRKKPN
jgi:hypothetical protein